MPQAVTAKTTHQTSNQRSDNHRDPLMTTTVHKRHQKPRSYKPSRDNQRDPPQREMPGREGGELA
ncbi:hypothetical protein EV192_11436 [Actinocrispum wychmicini]|uniref:Uncharacterized protein n=1 Tax=Actinocrispum wychmicini TaxID=1213861 RepID=A0A4R2IVK4_9PSEU|nr:hypothetical protein EV192_11436 [Actinocrispum wychmicini]